MLLIEAIRHLADPIPLPSATHGTQFSREHRNAEKLVPVPGIEPGSQGPGGSPLALETILTFSPTRAVVATGWRVMRMGAGRGFTVRCLTRLVASGPAPFLTMTL